VGIFILAEPEKSFLRDLKDVSFLDYPHPMSPPSLENVLDSLEEEKKGKIYQGFLGYYKAMTKYTKWSSAELVEIGNRFAIEGLGCAEAPELEASTVAKMGLKGTKGLRIVPNRPRAGRGGGGGGGGRGGRVGGGGIGKR
jgi:ATP-dependent RNA helicase MSS116